MVARKKVEKPLSTFQILTFIVDQKYIMPSGNGAKAQQKRERNQEKAQKQASAHSQLKVNQQAMSIKCKLCMVRLRSALNYYFF